MTAGGAVAHPDTSLKRVRFEKETVEFQNWQTREQSERKVFNVHVCLLATLTNCLMQI